MEFRRKLLGVLYLLVLAGLQEARGQCTNELYRSFDGSCNNLQNPTWGSTNIPYARMLPAKYADGKSSPPVAADGGDLPNARLLSTEVFKEGVQNSPDFTLLNMQFGQIVAHDMGLTRGVRDPITCCANGRVQPNRGARCFLIPVSQNDPVFSARGIECLNMVRTLTTCDVNPATCAQAEQLNAVTSYLDLSVVYGNSVEESVQLREPNTGFLKVEQRLGQDWPPRNPTASTSCTLRKPTEACYLTGDGRANQSPHLAILQITFVREHNRIARRLLALRPTMSAEQVFQEARRINIAQYQHIVYNEWLPNYLGRRYMLDRQLIYDPNGLVNDYNATMNPAVINSFSTAAFRFFHSSIQGTLNLYEESRVSLSDIDINDHTNNPTILEQTSDRYAFLLRGMTTQPMGKNDVSLDPATKHFLFRFNNMFGTDLKSIDIQRARDHGLPGYNDFAFLCYRIRAKNWAELILSMNPDAIELLSSYYRSVDDLDLAVGLAFERKLDGTQTGYVMRCIMEEQFQRTRKGDRYFYENGSKFTLKQVKEIRKANMAKILCDASTNVEQMQPAAFLLPSSNNQLDLCASLPTPSIKEF